LEPKLFGSFYSIIKLTLVEDENIVLISR